MLDIGSVRKGGALSILTVLMSGWISACSFQGDQLTGKVIKQSGTASIHEVSHNSIRSYMHKLDTIVFEPYYSELERDQYRFQYTAKIVEVVTALTKELEREPKLKLGLNSEQRQDFLNIALELKKQAEQLNTLLTEHKSHDLKNRLKQMTDVCNQCHRKYRSR